MSKNVNSFSSIPTTPGYIYNNYPNQINNYVYTNNNKKVTFNKDVVVYNVESYKEHNKKFCYNEDEQYAHLFEKKEQGYNDYYFKKYANQFNNHRDSFKKENKNKDDCCCIIL